MTWGIGPLILFVTEETVIERCGGAHYCGIQTLYACREFVDGILGKPIM